MKYVLHFHEINNNSLPIVGGKSANLGEITQAGFLVPAGFCITVAAFQTFINTSEKMDNYFSLLSQLKPEQFEDIKAIGKQIRDHIITLELNETIRSEILEAWTKLGSDFSYAVRSSATAEDLPTASFAGQQDTYLNVKGPDQLIEAVKKCWASLFTDRAIVYRINNGFEHRSVFLAVVIQQMVTPDMSGILFTADPVTGHRHTISIDAGFGLGEALVSGIVTPDLYKVRENQIIHKHIATKEQGIFAIPEGGTERKKLPIELQRKQVLSNQQIFQLAELGRKIEDHFGKEQDIEWCIAGDTIYILQSRPITSLYPVPPVRDNNYRIYYSIGHSQMMTDYMKPFGISVWKTMIPYGRESNQTESEVVLEAGGRLFMDMSELLYIKSARHKITQYTKIDSSISALKKIVLRDDFENRIPKKGNKRYLFRTYKSLFGLYAKMIPKMWKVIYSEDPSLAFERATINSQQQLSQYKEEVFRRSGSTRIKYIQELLGNLFSPKYVGDTLTYTYAGLMTLSIVEKKVKKWLEEELSPAIYKSPRGNVTSEMGLMIGDLADTARDYPEVIAYLEKAKDGTFIEGLQEVTGGNVFLAEWNRFIEKYGMRAPGEIDISRTRYKEAPSMLIPSILSHIRSNTKGEHWERFKQGEQEANEAIQALLTKLRSTQGGTRKAKKIARLITLYRNTVGIRELPKYLMIRYFDFFRDAILEEGQMLYKNGKIDSFQDVFYFSFDELISLLDNDLLEAKELVRSRKELEKQYKKLTPPNIITSDGEIFTAEQTNEHAPPGALVGIPVSAGVTEGYVKVVRSLEEGKLNKGEILVAPYTDPGWTPLFQSAKALVTEIGGMMTHGSVVAREYGIPAVVSVENAMKRLKDGQYIRVDGTNGFVEILEDVE